MRFYTHTDKSTGATQTQSEEQVLRTIGATSCYDEFDNTDLDLCDWSQEACVGDEFETNAEKWVCALETGYSMKKDALDKMEELQMILQYMNDTKELTDEKWQHGYKNLEALIAMVKPEPLKVGDVIVFATPSVEGYEGGEIIEIDEDRVVLQHPDATKRIMKVSELKFKISVCNWEVHKG